MLSHRLVIDIQTTQSLRFSERGIPRYTSDYARALLTAGAPVAGLMLNPLLPHPRRPHPDLARAPQLCWNTASEFRRLCESAEAGAGGGPVAYHVMSPLESFRPVQGTLPPYVLGDGIPLVCTIYDLIPEKFKVFEAKTPFQRLYRLRRDLMSRSDLIFAISRSTRNDVIEMMGVHPDRVVEVGTGASEYFRPPLVDDRPTELLRRDLPEINRPFVMTVTGVFGLDTRKNTEGVIDAFAALPADVRAAHQLVVACTLTDEDRVRWLEWAAGKGLQEGQLVLTGFVLDATLRALYQAATLFVNASHYEGFGLPALEAARCGCPTITSNTSSLPEILDHPPATFDPASRDEMAAVMERSLTDEGFRTELREAAAGAARHHTWSRVAANAIAGYERLDSPRPRRRRPPPAMRVALVGPFPPVPSGVAVYNGRLAERLGERCQLDCFAEGDFERPPPGGRHHRIFAARCLGPVLSPYAYDAVFYALANHPRHAQTYELAIRYPGILWLHDVHIAALYLNYAGVNFGPEEARDYMLHTLRQHYGTRVPEALIESDRWSSHDAYEEAGVRMGSALAAKSRGAIVSSELARTVFELDSGPFLRVPPPWVVPLAVPPPPGGLGSATSHEVGDPLIVALGHLDPVMRPGLLLEAMAVLRGAGRQARLVFLGDVSVAERADLTRHIGDLGLQDRVEITGWVDAGSYAGWLGRARCAVQLRNDLSGSASLAVVEALAHGIPTVTTLASCAELPPGTVRLVPHDVTAPALADVLATLLDPGPERERLVAGAAGYAASWTLDDVADRIVEIAGSRARLLSAG